MKAVVGFFDPGGAGPAREALLAGGFQPEDVMEPATIDDVPAYLEGEPEKMASRGWLVGTILGAVVGAALGWLVMSRYSMQYITLTVLISAAAGAAIGGYLLSIYSVRADEELDMDVREALGEGQTLLVVRASGSGVERAIDILSAYRSRHIATYPVPSEALEMG